MVKIAFLGLGVMGFPIAGHLSRAGYQVSVYNRTTEKVEKWLKTYDGEPFPTPAAASRNKEIVFSCVRSDNDLLELTLGKDGAFSTMKEGSIFIDHTTTSADIARKLEIEAQKRGIFFLDAPVSGGQLGAETGKLTIMCGGNQEAWKKIEKIMTCYAIFLQYIGKSGTGQLCKMINQICIAGIIQGLAEGLAFGEKAGLDMKIVLDTLIRGAAGSWQMENRGKTMVERKFDFGFSVELMRKDLVICLNEARRNGAALPITALVDQFYRDIQQQGGQLYDTSSLILRLE